MNKELLEALKDQVRLLKKYLKWCKDNNKPKEEIEVHTSVLNDLKTELKTLQKKL